MLKKFAVVFPVLGAFVCLIGYLTPGFSQEPFFKGKILRIVVAFSAGGGFDTYSRAIARHMGKHIPGNPTIVVENMPGAGGLIAAKYIYNSAKPDGLTIGNIHGNTVFGQVLGRKGIDLDSRKLEYIGVPVRDTSVCTLTKASGVTTMEQWLRSKEPVKLGGTAPGDAISDTARILKEALKLPVHLVEGYKGGADVRLAAEAKEVGGMCWAWEAAKSTWGQAIQAGEVNVIVQVVPQPHPDLPKVPLAIDFAKTEGDRQLIRAGIHDTQVTRRLYVLPPGTPDDQLQLLRKAFINTMKDSEFFREAQKSKLDVDPVAGEETGSIVKSLFNLDPAVIARLKKILG
jgi:tripartite-type tricarboxylate transporter receptor subunit TctC